MITAPKSKKQVAIAVAIEVAGLEPRRSGWVTIVDASGIAYDYATRTKDDMPPLFSTARVKYVYHANGNRPRRLCTQWEPMR